MTKLPFFVRLSCLGFPNQMKNNFCSLIKNQQQNWLSCQCDFLAKVWATSWSREWLSPNNSNVLANTLPCELSHTTLVTSEDHQHCNDDYMNVNDEDTFVLCQSFKTEPRLWRISYQKKAQNPLSVELVDDSMSPNLKDIFGGHYTV